MLPPSWKILKVSEEDGTSAICGTCSARVLEGKRLQFSHNKSVFTRVHLLVLQKDYAKTTQRISVKLGVVEDGSGFKMDLSIFELDTSLYLTF